jgi:hypothetical protein
MDVSVHGGRYSEQLMGKTFLFLVPWRADKWTGLLVTERQVCY